MSVRMKDGMYLRGRVWWIQYAATAPHRCRRRGPRPCPRPCPDAGRVERRVIRESTGSTRRGDAKTALAGKRTASARGTLVPDARTVSLEDLERLATDRFKADGYRASRRLAGAWKVLRSGLPTRALDVTTAAVARYERERLAGHARSTVNFELACLRRAFRLAVEARLLSHDQAPVVKTPTPRNARQGFFERESFEAVAARLPEWAAPVARFLFLTGWRVGEALALSWRDVDWRARVVRIDPAATKGGEGREFPFGEYPPLKALLESQLASGEPVSSALVFHKGAGRVPYRALKKAWRAACRAARQPEMLMHDLRRTAARDFRRAGVSEGEIMKLCGWRTRAMFDRYNIVDKRDREAAVARRAAALAE